MHKHKLMLLPVTRIGSAIPHEWRTAVIEYDRRRAYVREREQYIIDGKDLRALLGSFPRIRTATIAGTVPAELDKDDFYSIRVLIPDRRTAYDFYTQVMPIMAQKGREK